MLVFIVGCLMIYQIALDRNSLIIIEGTIRDPGGGPMGGVDLYVDGYYNTSTAADGTYLIYAMMANGVVEPRFYQTDFEPPSRTFHDFNLQNQDYVGYQWFTIEGYARDSEGNGINAVELHAVNNEGQPKLPVPTTNMGGWYQFRLSIGWTGTVTPQLPGWTFAPDTTYYVSVSMNYTDQDYVGYPPPDLIVENLNVTPNSANPGDIITLDFDITNQGMGPSMKTFSIGIYWSADTDIDPGADTELMSSNETDTLDPGESKNYTFQAASPPLPGSGYIGVFADKDSVVAESDEDNNAAAAGLTIFPTGADDEAQIFIPDRFQLHVNHPNPFNPETTILYDLPRASRVSLMVYSVQGQEIARLVHGELPAGRHMVRWGGMNTDGAPVPSGIYIYRIRAGEYTASRKMILSR